jgi:hypothetical protein
VLCALAGLPQFCLGDVIGVWKGFLLSISMRSRETGRDSIAARRVRLNGIGCSSGTGELNPGDGDELSGPPVNSTAGGGSGGRALSPSI